ncbi:hypothetical protein Scep_000087 [Stephania cephalantha]|uniref:Glutamate receptor n=1 Tax=Stephania cephalantha TaxID=152367 RepID=A0AAP0L5W9_9MAGN
MNSIWRFLVLWIIYLRVLSDGASRPALVNIGSIFTFDTINGKVAKIAMDAAVEDVNADPNVLVGSKLVITPCDVNFSGFLGIIGALKFMETDTVAIIGPQNSVMAHVLSHLANELQVPMLSFTATDPTLSALQYPFFVQTSPSDSFQMAAIAEMVSHYSWREVIAVFTDDDHGRNGIGALGDKLAERRCRISHKVPLPADPDIKRDEITDALIKVGLMESRVIVLHTYNRSGIIFLPRICNQCKEFSHCVRTHLIHQGKKLSSLDGSELSNGSIGLNTFGLYAYDTVWIIAHAVEVFFDQGGNISFSNDTNLNNVQGGALHLEAMSVFDGGDRLMNNIMNINMTGLTGQVRYNSERSLIQPAFDIINVIGTGYRQIGYWSNYSGLSVVSPEILYTKPANRSSSSQKLHSVIWPGETPTTPRGWVFPNNGKQLTIGVPYRVGFREFVSQVKGTDTVKGFCIDVFLAAINLLPYGLPYKFVPYGDGRKNPNYDELVRMITTNDFDAVVGDVAIVTNRTKIVDFTQPFIESGLVVVAPVRKLNSNPWAFLRPFTPMMWAVTAIFFLVVGAVVWVLEHRMNDEFRGPPKQQVVTILCLEVELLHVLSTPKMVYQGSVSLFLIGKLDLYAKKLDFFWFSFSTLFFAHRENTISTLGRLVLIIWLFVVLIINSSYTASLTSILTVQQLSSPIKGIESLVSGTAPIGYQTGSFAINYMIEELNIPKWRLVELGSPEEFAKALESGKVAAVVDELPYVDLFLSNQCKFAIIGPEFTKSGWGFAFPRDSPLAVDMSTAILTLSENGDLQRIHDKWLMRRACTSQSTELESDRLHLSSFWGLFLICGVACFLALLVYLIMMIRKFYRHYPKESNPSSQGSSRSARLQTFLSFVDEKAERGRSKRKYSVDEERGDESRIASKRKQTETSPDSHENGIAHTNQQLT